MVRVLFFGRLREIAGAHERTCDAASLSSLRAALAKENPALAEALAAPGVLIAVDKTLRRDDPPLSPDSEVAFMPPLSGG